MVNNPISQPKPWLYVFILVHVIAWTLVPYFTRYNLPMDALEGTIWGHTIQWGYDKNPFLNAWLTALAVDIGGQSGWTVYLFSQLSVAVCFLAIWELSKKMLPPIYALLAVLLLEGVQYYNVHAIDFNDNTLELGLWALTTLFFYRALQEQKTIFWLLTGVFAGLGMMTKYYTIMLLLPMGFFLLTQPQYRKSFFKPKIYWGFLAFLLIITPHVIWLSQHDFVTVNYALDRISSKPTWFNHVIFAASFAWQQFAAFLPPLFLTLLLLTGKPPHVRRPRVKIQAFDQQFLLYIGLGPFLLTLLLSSLTGIKLRAGWGEPLLSLWGIILMAWVQPYVTAEKFYRFAGVFFSLIAVTLTAYAVTLIRADQPSSANFPGREIASALTQEWHADFHKKLFYVAGPRWLAGNIAFYSTDHPAVYIDWSQKLSPWIDEAELKTQGAVFVWDASEKNDDLPRQILLRFNLVGKPKIQYFDWRRNPRAKPVAIGVAFLGPETTT